jgi:hypothetical protein
LAILAQNAANIMQKLDHNIVFFLKKNAKFLAENWQN